MLLVSFQVKYRKWELFHLVDWACETLQEDKMLLDIVPPIYLVGDIHGQGTSFFTCPHAH